MNDTLCHDRMVKSMKVNKKYDLKSFKNASSSLYNYCDFQGEATNLQPYLQF